MGKSRFPRETLTTLAWIAALVVVTVAGNWSLWNG